MTSVVVEHRRDDLSHGRLPRLALRMLFDIGDTLSTFLRLSLWVYRLLVRVLLLDVIYLMLNWRPSR